MDDIDYDSPEMPAVLDATAPRPPAKSPAAEALPPVPAFLEPEPLEGENFGAAAPAAGDLPATVMEDCDRAF
eukprot:3138821-Alexandrium_andersonii.AAC.1